MKKKDVFYMTATEIHRLNEYIQYLYNTAFIDLMTGLNNRNAYEAKIKSIQNTPSQLKGLQVVMIDIDGLKFINDTFGHESGDDAIKTVSRCIHKAFQNSGLCARYGGDEFICLLYGDISKKVVAFNRMIKLESYYSQYPLSVSVGIAEFDADKDSNIESLINRCDQIMYFRKQSNKEKFCFKGYAYEQNRKMDTLSHIPQKVG